MIIEFWTQQLNPITCYQATKDFKKKEKVEVKAPTLNEKIQKERRTKATNKQAVTIEDDFGQKIEFDTVIEAADFLQLKKIQLYNILNNRMKNKTKYKIYKS